MIEFDKYYRLKPDGRYWCIPLQTIVSFPDGVVVKAESRSAFDIGDKGRLWFGKLVDTRGSMDYDTNNEIEFFEEDVVSEYKFRDNIPFPPFLMYSIFPEPSEHK